MLYFSGVLVTARQHKTFQATGEPLLDLIGPHQKMILAAQINHLEILDQQVVELDQGIEARFHPFTLELARLESITGIGRRIAEVIF
jgi:transposase